MDKSFLNPQFTNDGRNYDLVRFEEIVKECWYISDNIHTSYSEALDLSYQERVALIKCINDKIEGTQKAIDKMKQESNIKNK